MFGVNLRGQPHTLVQVLICLLRVRRKAAESMPFPQHPHLGKGYIQHLLTKPEDPSVAPRAHKVEREICRLLQIVLPTPTGAYFTHTEQINNKINLLYLTKLTRRNLDLFLDFLNDHMLPFD